MPVTQKAISQLQPNAEEITQVGSKQLFIVTMLSGLEIIYSYKTIIAYSLNGVKIYITKGKHSTTTSRHCIELSRKYPRSEWIAMDEFNQKLSELNHEN